MYLGIFLASFALFFFEIVCGSMLGFSLGSSYVFIVIGIAMLGVSAAGSALSVLAPKIDTAKLPRVGFWLCVAMSALFLMTFLTTTEIKNAINTVIDHPPKVLLEAPNWARHEYATQQYTPWLGAVMLSGYFAFGLLVTWTMLCAGRERYHRIYGADLVGGALGALGAYGAFEWLPFRTVAIVPTAAALCGGLAYLAGAVSKRRLFATAAVLVSFLALASMGSLPLEPRAHSALVTRQFIDTPEPTRELWSAWTSYSHVGAFEINHERTVMVLGNGEGVAELSKYQPDVNPPPSTRITLETALGTPKSMLILFAGAGADMVQIESRLRGQTHLTGVELNPRVVEAISRLPEFGLQEFFKLPNIKLVVKEARSFLEGDPQLYDVIFLSWTGATSAYLTGAIGPTTQFVYTKEAFKRMFSRLTPNGFVIVINTNKIRVLAAARQALEELGNRAPEECAVVLSEPGTDTGEQFAMWDQFRVLLKPSGFKPNELALLKKNLAFASPEILYAPGAPRHPVHGYYYDVLHAPDLEKFMDGLSQRTDLMFSVPTDDRPFIFNETRSSRYLDPSTWWAAISSSELVMKSFDYRLRWLAYLMMGALALVLSPLILFRRTRISFGVRQARYLAYFLALGAGYMLIEIGIMHRASLVLGNPGLAIAVVLGGAVAFTGVGSLVAGRFIPKGDSLLRWLTLGLAGYSVLMIVLGPTLIAHALGLPIAYRILGVLITLFPLFGIAGFYFPLGIARCETEDSRLVPWAWAVNGAFGAIAAALSPLIASSLGFNALIAIGGALYVTALILPKSLLEKSAHEIRS